MIPPSRGLAAEGTQSHRGVLCGLQSMVNAIKYANRGLVFVVLLVVLMCFWHQFRRLQCQGRMELETR